MDFGGILAGAMAGGGKAIQQNAQSQLEKQREQALIELEQKRADQRAAATAQSEAAQAATDRQAEFENERALTILESRLEAQNPTGEDKTANQRDFELLTSLTDSEGNRLYSDSEATATVFNTDGGINYGDAMELVTNQYENMNVVDQRNLRNRLDERGMSLNEYFDEQTVEVINRAKEVDYGRSGQARGSSQQNNRGGGIFSFGSGGTLTETPSGGLTALPNPTVTPNVLPDN